ncbi:thiamine phosphate synthase [Solimonas marina]|uniref:Thiamine-phosphate synthase n=1 Tax=Solimonas marina TaxID=2714601 RepID=A0A969W9Y6_9GAMM|nr:thiamine phosphate synthase [Solimonas marina]NKF22225.1 thiamine phosphate synthase [Solimonas marina]
MTVPSGLYAITPDALVDDDARLMTAVAAALRGGASLIQYRDKRSDAARRHANAAALNALCREAGALLVINDDTALAAAVGAAGVHLGASDGSLAAARAQLGPDAVIGATCGNSLERARAAVAAGASYVAFGRFFASKTKPDAPPAELATLAAAHAALDAPICAIGGLTPDNLGPVARSGATLIAAIDGVFGAADIEAAARAYVAAIGGQTARIP